MSPWIWVCSDILVCGFCFSIMWILGQVISSHQVHPVSTIKTTYLPLARARNPRDRDIAFPSLRHRDHWGLLPRHRHKFVFGILRLGLSSPSDLFLRWQNFLPSKERRARIWVTARKPWGPLSHLALVDKHQLFVGTPASVGLFLGSLRLFVWLCESSVAMENW